MHAEGNTRFYSFLVFLILAVGYSLYGAVASMGMSLLLLILAAFLAAAQATFGGYCHPVLRVLPALASVGTALALSLSPEAAILSLAAPILGLLLGWAARRGENRVTLTAVAAVAMLLILSLLGIYRLFLLSQSTGQADLFVCLHDALDSLRDSFAQFQREGLKVVAHFAEQSDASFLMPSEGVLKQSASHILSMMPGIILLLCGAFGLCITYLMQLFAMVANDRRLFSRSNAAYELSVIPAALYLLSQLILLFYSDPTSVVYLTLINTVIVLCPLLAFAKCRELPRLYRFLVRFTSGRFDLAIWGILTVICIFSYASYIVPILAIWQAISILKSAFGASRSEGTH